eukprot:s2217_g8.t1
MPEVVFASYPPHIPSKAASKDATGRRSRRSKTGGEQRPSGQEEKLAVELEKRTSARFTGGKDASKEVSAAFTDPGIEADRASAEEARTKKIPEGSALLVDPKKAAGRDEIAKETKGAQPMEKKTDVKPSLPQQEASEAQQGDDKVPAEVNDCALPPHLLANRDGDGRTVAHLAAARGDNDVALLRYLVETCQMPVKVLEMTDNWKPSCKGVDRHRTPAHDAAVADACSGETVGEHG